MTSVFISYSRADIDFVQQLAGDLHQAGLDVWWDLSDIRGSDVWEHKIQDGLKSSKYFIIVLTPDSLASRWVRREYLSADSRGLTIIPLRLKEYEELPLTLRDLQPVNAVNRPYEDTLAEILTILKGKTSTSKARAITPVSEVNIQNHSVHNAVVEIGSTISTFEVAGTIALVLYFLQAWAFLFISEGPSLIFLFAVSALLGGGLLISRRLIPASAWFRYAAASYALSESVSSYFFYSANIFLLILVGASAFVCAGFLAANLRSPKKATHYSAISLAVFVVSIALRTVLWQFGIYPDQVLWLIVGVITALLLFLDL